MKSVSHSVNWGGGVLRAQLPMMHWISLSRSSPTQGPRPPLYWGPPLSVQGSVPNPPACRTPSPASDS